MVKVVYSHFGRTRTYKRREETRLSGYPSVYFRVILNVPLISRAVA